MQEGEQKESSGLNSEAGRQAARDCARQLKEIAGFARERLPWGETYHQPNFSSNLQGSLSEPCVDLVLITDTIRGVGDHGPSGGIFIGFENDPVLRSEIRESTGVDTACVLSLSIHTDQATLGPVRDLLRQRHTTFEALQTSFYFGLDGSFAKTVRLPLGLPDNRRLVQRSRYFKTVLADMTAEDFELAGAAVSLIRDQLRMHPS